MGCKRSNDKSNVTNEQEVKFSNMYSRVERAKRNEKMRLQEIDILDKDVEVYDSLSKTEIEINWFLRHMPEFFTSYYFGRIKQSYENVSEYLLKYDYIQYKFKLD